MSKLIFTITPEMESRLLEKAKDKGLKKNDLVRFYISRGLENET
jgi:hypothetical protein